MALGLPRWGLGLKVSPLLQSPASSPQFCDSLLPPHAPSRQMQGQDHTWWVLGEALAPRRHPPPGATGATGSRTVGNLFILESAPAAALAPETLQGLLGRVNPLILVTMRFQGWWEAVSMETEDLSRTHARN